MQHTVAFFPVSLFSFFVTIFQCERHALESRQYNAKALLLNATIHRWPNSLVFFLTIRSRIVFSSYNFYLQAIFASSIPEIIDLVGSRSKYSGEYKREHGKRYYYQITSYSPLYLLSINFTFFPVYICICIYLLIRINECTQRGARKHTRILHTQNMYTHTICTRAFAHDITIYV